MAVKKHRRKLISIVVLLALVYVSSYVILSRRGFAQADEWNMSGFYFIFPSDHTEWQVNWSLVIVFYPLIVIDNVIGTGRPIGCEPMYRLSDGGQQVDAGDDGRELIP